jgi:multidrug efflux pump subunit AcrA (membrane-fusion protein)
MGGRDVVFVPEGRGRFRAKPVRLGTPRAGGWLEVYDGLRLGDSVVVTGAFALKTKMLQAAEGEGSDK